MDSRLAAVLHIQMTREWDKLWITMVYLRYGSTQMVWSGKQRFGLDSTIVIAEVQRM